MGVAESAAGGGRTPEVVRVRVCVLILVVVFGGWAGGSLLLLGLNQRIREHLNELHGEGDRRPLLRLRGRTPRHATPSRRASFAQSKEGRRSPAVWRETESGWPRQCPFFSLSPASRKRQEEERGSSHELKEPQTEPGAVRAQRLADLDSLEHRVPRLEQQRQSGMGELDAQVPSELVLPLDPDAHHEGQRRLPGLLWRRRRPGQQTPSA